MSDTTFSVRKDQLEVVSSRSFTATPERLWEAITNAEQIPQWWGPAKYVTVIDQYELNVGGKWRFKQTAEDGTLHAFRGEYKEIDEPHKIVRSFEYEPKAGHILIETMLIEPIDANTTKLTAIAHYDNLDDLEEMVGMGMESGEREGFERLAVLVEQ
jgi:uncharacterized protein YndB with AHSA1/START domain